MCQKYMAAGHTRDNTPQRWWSRTAGLETVYACECVCVWAGGGLWISRADWLQFNWESAGLCRRATGMCIVKLYFSFVLTKCWCKGRGSEKPKDRESEREKEGRGEQERRKKELDCIIDYPITSTALRNYPSPRQAVRHPEQSRATDSCSAAHKEWRVALGGKKKDG